MKSKNTNLKVINMSDSKVDSIVTGSFKTNKFSSSAFISHITNIPHQEVDASITRLINKGRVYQSVGGVPKRYSLTDERLNESVC